MRESERARERERKIEREMEGKIEKQSEQSIYRATEREKRKSTLATQRGCSWQFRDQARSLFADGGLGGDRGPQLSVRQLS